MKIVFKIVQPSSISRIGNPPEDVLNEINKLTLEGIYNNEKTFILFQRYNLTKQLTEEAENYILGIYGSYHPKILYVKANACKIVKK